MIVIGDCREALAEHGPFDMLIADPPYGDTALQWDRRVSGWMDAAQPLLKPSGSLWVFGSMRFLLTQGVPPGWRYAQDIVWEKANGTGFAADRFKRVHEHVVQFWPAGRAWRDVYNDVQRRKADTQSNTVRIRRENHVQHAGSIVARDYVDDGTRIERSVIKCQSARGGFHPTQKPVELLSVLIRTSCPPGGLVGDLFAGSAAAGEAASLNGRRYVGCEIDPEMAALASARLALAT